MRMKNTLYNHNCLKVHAYLLTFIFRYSEHVINPTDLYEDPHTTCKNCYPFTHIHMYYMIHIFTYMYNLFFWGKIDGKIEAPKRPKQWGNKRTESWLMFKNVESLFINGSGVLDPHGENWWRSVRHSKRPRVSHLSTIFLFTLYI